MRKLIAGPTAAALLACSTIAQAAPVASAAPIENVRIGAPVSEAENLGGAAVGGLALLALLIFIYLVQKDKDEDIPTSV